MRFLLAAVNAKYIHSNLAVYSLRAFAKKQLPDLAADLAEYTINQQEDQILGDLFRRKPQFIGFSCYIWNIDMISRLIPDLHQVLPDTEIWLGGPEVSYDAAETLSRFPEVRGIFCGEGERTFAETAEVYENCESQGKWEVLDAGLEEVPGLVFRKKDGSLCETGPRSPMPMDELPFVYQDMSGFENRIVYYESSRGCPFSCSYCLSSLDKTVRFRSLSLVLEELDFFLEKRVPQVKFVDRTFNCRREHTLGIWRHIMEHDNGVTNFHFEISADLLDDEELELLGRMRPGLVQLEIGVQSTNPQTIREIRRRMDLGRLKEAAARIWKGNNVHQHLDLIAGLPFEDFSSFLRSFDEVYRMGPDQLQLGFLKVLKGSFLAENQEQYGLKCRRTPPYEVMSTKWLSYGEVLRLKAMEEMLEVYGNSGQFRAALRLLEREAGRPSELFLKLADYYEREGLFGRNIARLERYEIFYRFLEEFLERDVKREEKLSAFRDRLVFDLYLRENAKSRPSFALDQTPAKKRIREFFIGEEQKPRWLLGYEGYDSRQIAKMAHLEAMEDGTFLLFDYRNRDPKDHNGRARRLIFKEQDSEWTEIPLWESQEEGVL